MNKRMMGHLLALVTISIWSSTFIVSKLLLAVMSPLQILTVRFLIAIVFLSLLQPRFRKPGPIVEELLFLAIGAALVFYFICENNALQRTYTANVSLIVATIPFLTGVLSRLFFKTRFFYPNRIIGFVLAYAGVFLIVFSSSRLEGVSPVGDLLAMSAAILFACYSLLMEQTSKNRTLIQLTRKVFIYGFLILVVLSLASPGTLDVAQLTLQTVPSLLFLGIIASSLAFILWNRAIKVIGPVQTNQYIYLIPVITTLLSALILNERITWITMSGAALILLGLYLSERATVRQSDNGSEQAVYENKEKNKWTET